MGQEIRLFGPPGTGKTSTLVKWIAQAAEKFGSGAIFVASFTRTAAAELVGRDLPIDKAQVGTLHAHAYRALGCPTIAETKVEEWNEEHPHLQLGKAAADLDDPQNESGARTEGNADRFMAELQVLRARLVPEEFYYGPKRELHEFWSAWKKKRGYLDFTDLIEVALRDVATPEGAPSVGFLDEVQDFTPLELALVRKWCEPMDHYVLAGDDDQTLYNFKGATPDAWLFPRLPSPQIRVLEQSYRVPSAVHSYACRLTDILSSRQPKDYRPTGESGRVSACTGTWKDPEPIANDIEERMGRGKRCMVLASCAYMLAPLQAVLRERAVPFFNPYRRNRGDWNPLARGSEKRRTAVDRIGAFLSTDPEFMARPFEEWRWRDIALWAEPIRSEGTFTDGFKAAVRAAKPDEAPDPWDLAAYIRPEALTQAFHHDLAWYLESLLPSKRKPFELAVKVALKLGKRAIIEPPRDKSDWSPSTVPWTTLGTIHSVKGGEADVVFLMPDLSGKGFAQWMCKGDDGRDAIIRQFYVGATRAREELVLCQPAASWAFPLQRFVA